MSVRGIWYLWSCSHEIFLDLNGCLPWTVPVPTKLRIRADTFQRLEERLKEDGLSGRPTSPVKPISFARSESDWSLLESLDVFARQSFSVQQIRAGILGLQAIEDPVVAENYFSCERQTKETAATIGAPHPIASVSQQVPYRIIEITQLVRPPSSSFTAQRVRTSGGKSSSRAV